ncbi:MAG: hypothetical protein LBU73_09660 [Helicobacteraceae bacterium]|jgi:hypothetical protein|nr:hypothetical protein [Helicobacteraceae bacterium]
MKIEYFNEYRKWENLGVREKTKAPLNNFIKSFENDAEKISWTMEFLSNLELNNGRYYIRNELFEEIVFPILFNGYKNGDVSLILRLIKLSSNLTANNKLWKKLDYKIRGDLISERYRLDPNNDEVLRLYLYKLEDGIEDCFRDYPDRINYGYYNTAAKDQCDLIMNAIKYMRKVDKNNKYGEFLNTCENKLLEYMSGMSCGGENV